MSQILFFKALGPNERWVTVRPPGHEKGQPLLVRENSDGSATVIGGAGGALNHARLGKLRSPQEYARASAEKKKARQEARKEQAKRDKEAGVHEAKKSAKERVGSQRREHQRKFIQAVAEKSGWDKSDLQFDEQKHRDAGRSEGAIKKLARQHHNELLKRAKSVTDNLTERVVADPEYRADAGLGEIPLDSKNPDVVTVQDLDPITPRGAALGYSTDYKGRAESAGLSKEELTREAEELREQKRAQLTDAQRRAAITRGETAKMVGEELRGIRDPLPDVHAAEIGAADAAELLRERKRLESAERQAAAAQRDIDSGDGAPKAYAIDAEPDEQLDEKVRDSIESDLRTVRTRAFLTAAEDVAGGDAHQALRGHVGVGAYNSINALALTVGGDALVDRSVVDVLGVTGAAQVLVRRLKQDLNTEEYQQLTDGMQEFHLHHYMETSKEALEQAEDLRKKAADIELPEAHTGADLQVMQAINDRRRQAVTDAQKILGQALGEMEANGTLVHQLQQGAQDDVRVPLSGITPEDAIRQVRAIGLQRGDYKIEHADGRGFLTINAAGMDRLAKPVDREALQQVRRNLDIIEGRQDEENWLPLGVANRPDLAMDVKDGVAPRLAKPFDPGADLEQSLRDYIGGRAADGDTPADIVADIQSADFFNKVGGDRTNEYYAALNAVAPMKGADGKQNRAESLAPAFEKYADAFADREYGGKLTPLHRQKFHVDQKAVDSMHRALSDHPEGTAAYKPIGEMTPQDQRALREYFHRHVARESPEAGELRGKLEQLEGSEPEKETVDMFGESGTNPEWLSWRQERDEAAEKLNASSLTWSKYVGSMRGNAAAYQSVQDLIRSDVGNAFAGHYNKLSPGAPLKVGRAVIRNNLAHLDTIDPEARDARLAKERALVDSLRERSGGRYAAGSVRDKLDAAREEREAFDQSQMGFFADEPAPTAEKPLAKDERHTLGHAAERQVAAMMGIVGKNFRPGQPLKLWNPSMNGKGIARQRAVKLIDANKRVSLSFGVGSGKSLIGLSAFTNLHQQGKAKRGLYLVPSIVQGQFRGEALRYLEPGKFNWHIEPGASREERIKAYKNPGNDFAVMTHQSFRDDMVHLGAKGAGISEDQMRDQLAAMQPADRKAWMKNVLEKEGINFDYLMVDEGHDLLNRAGKENSTMANVVDAFSSHTPYYVNASGDPIKNDPSEAFDLLSKMDPERYNDRAAFMRRYGVDTIAAKEGLRREMARHVYPSRIDPEVMAEKRQVKTGLSDGQKSDLQALDQNLVKARIARMRGKVDVGAMKAVSPGSFEGVPADQHEKVAAELQKSIGILRESAQRNIIYNHADNPAMDAVVKHADSRRGKPGVVFARNLEAVQQLKERLEKAGHRVVAITGADSSKEKAAKLQRFQPEQGEAHADIVVASDAAATGANLQRGQWLWQYDTPDTAKTHAQRAGRIHRIGQKNDVELIDGLPDHPSVHRARDRLAKKYELRDLMTTPLGGLDDTGLALHIKKAQNHQQEGLDL